MDLIDFVFAFFVAAMPVSQHVSSEAPAVTWARYEAIASDIAEVASAPDVEPLFRGSDARARTAILLASVAVSESQLRADVDACTRKGDGGKSATIFQLQRAPREACTDRQLATRIAIERVRASMTQCRTMPESERLAAYISGSCRKGVGESKRRFERAFRWMRQHPVFDASLDVN